MRWRLGCSLSEAHSPRQPGGMCWSWLWVRSLSRADAPSRLPCGSWGSIRSRIFPISTAYLTLTSGPASSCRAACSACSSTPSVANDDPVVIGLDDTIERRCGARIKARGIYLIRSALRTATSSRRVACAGFRSCCCPRFRGRAVLGTAVLHRAGPLGAVLA